MQAKGREKDEELALFFEMRRREKENEVNTNNTINLLTSEELDDLPLDSSNTESSPISKSVSSLPLQKKSRDEFLNSENDKSDYDWLLTPPGTPLLSLEMESQKTETSQLEIPVSRPVALRSRPSNIQVEPASKGSIASKHKNLPSSEGPKPGTRRSATPTGRSTLPSTTKPARSSTPNSRPSIVSTKSVAPQARSSTPTRSSARSSTPTARPSLPASHSTARSATPTRQQSTSVSASGPTGRASSTTKLRPTSSKIAASSRGPSPTVKSRPWKPSEMPGFPADAPSNLRTSVPARPASASRVRPAVPSIVKSSSTVTGSNGRPGQQSSSPSRGRASHGGVTIGNLNRSMNRSRCGDSDEVSPVVMGTKMVERVVNMRKLAPPKRDNDHSGNSSSAGKSLSSDSLGFGRTLSKKSLDMAIRHMDIRRTMQGGGLRPVVTSVPASSVYSIRATKNRATSSSDSPHATSSNSGSEPSVIEGNDI